MARIIEFYASSKIPTKRVAYYTVTEGKGHCVLRRGKEACIALKAQDLRDGEAVR